MVKIKKLKVKLFADGANKDNMIKMYNNPIIDGLTTNPTLMKKAGIKNYKEFAIAIIMEEYELEGVTRKDAEEIYDLFMEFDDLTKITEIIDAYEVWYLEKMNERNVYFERNEYEA